MKSLVKEQAFFYVRPSKEALDNLDRLLYWYMVEGRISFRLYGDLLSKAEDFLKASEIGAKKDE